MVKLIFKQDSMENFLAIPLISSRNQDEVFWPYSNEGSYTVKSGYGVIFEEYFDKKGSLKDKEWINEKKKRFCKTTLWKLPGPQSWKILLWKIITGSLPVGSEFVKRNFGWDPFCTMCSTENRDYETPGHLFRDCEVSARIWFDSALGIMTKQNRSLGIGDWIINWITYLKDHEDSTNCVTQFLAILHSIWTLRNNSIFRGEGFIPKVFFNQLANLASLAMKEPKKGEWNLADFQNESQGSPGLDYEGKRIKEGQPFFLIDTFGSLVTG
ncbi:uncharacterized protein LOC141587521 [Silene latifolia]|uniref:uncharacterized protein LOC141587521 n=1 Tax=Silene latifolia TaxID=37657 RepID=UPI003D7705CE